MSLAVTPAHQRWRPCVAKDRPVVVAGRLLACDLMISGKLCLVVLFGGMPPIATAQPSGNVDAYPAAVASARTPLHPGPYPESDGYMGNYGFPLTAEGRRRANAQVRHCGDAFCTIQINRDHGTTQYVVYELSNCDTWKLHQFKGRFLARNGGSLKVDLLNSSRKPIYRLFGGGETVVNWDKVYYIRTCNKH